MWHLKAKHQDNRTESYHLIQMSTLHLQPLRLQPEERNLKYFGLTFWLSVYLCMLTFYTGNTTLLTLSEKVNRARYLRYLFCRLTVIESKSESQWSVQ